MSKMSTDNLRNNLTNLQRTYLWDVLIPNPLGGGDPDTISIRARAMPLPGWSFGQILVPYKQSPGVVYPGKLAFSHDWVCTFIEGEDHAVFDIIYDWRQLIVHDKTNIGTTDVAIKSDIYLKLLKTDGDESMKIRMVGCFPRIGDDVPMSYDDESTVLYSVTWSYDRWEKVAE